MGLLTADAIHEELASMDGWAFEHNALQKKIKFDTYMAGIDFVNELAAVAEAKNHHPDLSVGWCKVEVRFTSHDQGGVTRECIEMAKAVDTIF
jgi:4a-hydroxytetrahydrobiopterin dehydratase